MATKSKAKAVKQKVTITIPAVNTAWTSLVAKTQKIDITATDAVIAFAKIITARKVDLRNARKSVEELGTTSKVLLTSQIEALPTLLALIEKSKKDKAYAAFGDLDIKAKLTKATAAYKLGVDEAVSFPTYEGLCKEITAFNKRKNSGSKSKKSAKESKESKSSKKVSVDDALKSAIALVNGLGDGVEDSTYDLIVELYNITALKIGVDA
jgi:hypothetical protein